jgi:hypothetical protein
MRNAVKPLLLLVVLIGIAGVSVRRVDGAAQVWTGIVSDSQCRGNHGGEVDERECTLKCIKAGDKFVLVTDYGTKVWSIANQDFPGLAQHASETVKITGELKGDAIVVSKIEMK